MLWFMVLQMVSTLVELIHLRRTSTSDKELEILLLRRQLAIYERKHLWWLLSPSGAVFRLIPPGNWNEKHGQLRG
jgi:hypothetical protein